MSFCYEKKPYKMLFIIKYDVKDIDKQCTPPACIFFAWTKFWAPPQTLATYWKSTFKVNHSVHLCGKIIEEIFFS